MQSRHSAVAHLPRLSSVASPAHTAVLGRAIGRRWESLGAARRNSLHRLQSPLSTSSIPRQHRSPSFSQQRPESTVAAAAKPSVGSRIYFSLLLVAAFSAGVAMAAAPVADTLNGFVRPPTDEETLTLYSPETARAAEINNHIVSHPLAARLRQEQGTTESRPHLKIPEKMRPYNLTGGTLMGDDKIEVPPLSFSRTEQELPTLVQLSYLGPSLCGHPGIIHGGLLATLLDEGLARACFPALPNKVGVTASLKIDYRVPCPANSYIVLKAETTKVEGRKAWVKGWIEILGEDDGSGTKIVEAEALFIEPKGAKQMARIYSSQ